MREARPAAGGAVDLLGQIAALARDLAGCRGLHRRYERGAERFLTLVGIAAVLFAYRHAGTTTKIHSDIACRSPSG